MDTLGTDLVLLALNPKRGRVHWLEYLRHALTGAELIALIVAGLADIRDGRIVLCQSTLAGAATGSTGDQELDAALASIAGARRPPRLTSWMGRPRRRIVPSYLGKLAAAGVLEPVGDGRRQRWRIIDQAVVAAARARLDEVALGSGPADAAQTAYAGLAHAARLDRVLYPGRKNRRVHKRCQQLGRGRQPAAPLSAGVGAAGADAQLIAITAVTEAAIRAAVAASSSA